MVRTGPSVEQEVTVLTARPLEGLYELRPVEESERDVATGPDVEQPRDHRG